MKGDMGEYESSQIMLSQHASTIMIGNLTWQKLINT